MYKRLMYLHHILSLEENRLVQQVFSAHLENPSKGDWTEIVKQDLIDYKIVEPMDKLAKMSKNAFKKKVSTACRQFSFEKLVSKKGSKSKLLTHTRLKTASYFMSTLFSTKESNFFFKSDQECWMSETILNSYMEMTLTH